jgi:hypothetical protein
MRDFESHELVQIGNLVTQKLQKLVRISNAISSRHCVRLHALIEITKSLFTTTGVDLGKTDLYRILVVLFIVLDSLLKLGDAKDTLKRCIDPARSTLIAKAEHLICRSLKSLSGMERDPFLTPNRNLWRSSWRDDTGREPSPDLRAGENRAETEHSGPIP